MLGAIIGDIVGSRFEFNNHRSTDFEFFHPDCTFTDDTICTVAVADWLMNPPPGLPVAGLDLVMRYWCRKYPNPSGGYGGMFAKWVRDEINEPYNSFGNGAAMRVSPVGWLFDVLYDVRKIAEKSASITHNHPEGIKGAQCIADCILQLRQGCDKEILLRNIKLYYGYRFDVSCDTIRKTNFFDETCLVTVPQAIQCFIESTDFESAIRLAVSIGGDSDTIAAITGSLAEAYYGIPEEIKRKAITYLPDDMLKVIAKFTEITKIK